MLKGIRMISDLPLEGRRVFVRVDFNVPSENGQITDDTRIRATLPTLAHIMERGGKPILASHLGRPKGKRNTEYSLESAGKRLAELLNCDVFLTDDCIGDGVRSVVRKQQDGQVVLLENLRFHTGEEHNDESFARELASFTDIYVNDAFGVSHRAHASVDALPKLTRERGAGFLMQKELESLSTLMKPDVPKPYVAILGGGKVADKIDVIEVLLTKVNALLLGGAMANTFLAALGHRLGTSRVEEDRLAFARSVLERAKSKDVALLVPSDVVVAEGLDASEGMVTDVEHIPADKMALDIGPKTVAAFREQIVHAHAVFWNGPMGVFEKAPFSKGTFQVAKALAECPGFTVVGGGDSMAAVHEAGYADRYSHISTGGGASLEYLEGRKLPGIESLRV